MLPPRWPAESAVPRARHMIGTTAALVLTPRPPASLPPTLQERTASGSSAAVVPGPTGARPGPGPPRAVDTCPRAQHSPRDGGKGVGIGKVPAPWPRGVEPRHLLKDASVAADDWPRADPRASGNVEVALGHTWETSATTWPQPSLAKHWAKDGRARSEVCQNSTPICPSSSPAKTIPRADEAERRCRPRLTQISRQLGSRSTPGRGRTQQCVLCEVGRSLARLDKVPEGPRSPGRTWADVGRFLEKHTKVQLRLCSTGVRHMFGRSWPGLSPISVQGKTTLRHARNWRGLRCAACALVPRGGAPSPAATTAGVSGSDPCRTSGTVEISAETGRRPLGWCVGLRRGLARTRLGLASAEAGLTSKQSCADVGQASAACDGGWRLQPIWPGRRAESGPLRPELG